MPTPPWLVGITAIRSPRIVAVLELRVDCGTSINKFPVFASASEQVHYVIISELNKPHTAFLSMREVSTSPSSRNATSFVHLLCSTLLTCHHTGTFVPQGEVNLAGSLFPADFASDQVR